MDYRKITVDDAELLAELSAETFRLAHADLHDAANIEAYCAAVYTADKMRALLNDPLIHCEVVRIDGASAGYVLVSHRVGSQTLAGSELKRLYILPAG